jgi:hypothetical protein
MKREERVAFCKEYITSLLLQKLKEWKTRFDLLDEEGQAAALYNPDWDNGCYGRRLDLYEKSEIVDLALIEDWIAYEDLWSSAYEITREQEEDVLMERFLAECPGGIRFSEEFYEYEEMWYEYFPSSPCFDFIDEALYEILDLYHFDKALDFVDNDRLGASRINAGEEPYYKDGFLSKICYDKAEMREKKIDLVIEGSYKMPVIVEDSCEIVKVVETYTDEWNRTYKNIVFDFCFQGYTGTIIWSEDWATYELQEVDKKGFDLDGDWYGSPRHKGVYKILDKKKKEYYAKQ